MSSLVISGDTSGTVTLQAPAVAGTTVITLPSSSMTLGSGSLLNIQYFTTAGTATYTPTAGTNSVIVEVVGGGGGGEGSGGTVRGSTGGTSSFGALVSATGGGGSTSITTTGGGLGSSGDLNLRGNASVGAGVACMPGYFMGNSTVSGPVQAPQANSGAGGAGLGSNGSSGGYARKKITSAFSGVTVTVGAGGAAGNGTTLFAGASGIVIVYEYA